MKKLTQLSTAVLLALGLAMTGNASADAAEPAYASDVAAAAAVTVKTTKDDLDVVVGKKGSVNVLDNDTFDGVKILAVKGYNGAFGTVSCTKTGRCTYTSNARKTATNRSDLFAYTVKYSYKVGKKTVTKTTAGEDVDVHIDHPVVSADE